MAKRVKLAEKPKKEKRVEVADDEETSSYFTSEKENLMGTSSGCTTLDQALGGKGYILGRMVNIVGDKSTAKTGLATEALINFKLTYPEGLAAYRETEGAYDKSYSGAMGLPVDDIDFGDEDNPIDTVEKFDRDLRAFAAECGKKKVPGCYVLDSFDALSDEAEMDRDLDKGSYGMEKQKKVGIMFRKLVKVLEKNNVMLFIVSQLRENINAMFGEKYRRSGGKALDFYATHIIWLAHMKTLKRTIKKVERAYGIDIRAKVKKNKVGFPFREADFSFIFGFGVDDVSASIDFLESVERLDVIGVKAGKAAKGKKKQDDDDGVMSIGAYRASIEDMSDKEYNKERKRLAKAVKQVWNEIETTFMPKRRKY